MMNRDEARRLAHELVAQMMAGYCSVKPEWTAVIVARV